MRQITRTVVSRGFELDRSFLCVRGRELCAGK